MLEVRNFSYPLDVIPNSVRWMAKLHGLVKDVLPWSWQFALKKTWRSKLICLLE